MEQWAPVMVRYFRGAECEVSLSPFCQTASDGMSQNGLKLHQQSFRLDIRKKFFLERPVKHWNRLHREAGESPSVEIPKKCVTVALEDMVQWGMW